MVCLGQWVVVAVAVAVVAAALARERGVVGLRKCWA